MYDLWLHRDLQAQVGVFNQISMVGGVIRTIRAYSRTLVEVQFIFHSAIFDVVESYANRLNN